MLGDTQIQCHHQIGIVLRAGNMVSYCMCGSKCKINPVTHKHKVAEEVGCKYFLQAIMSDAILLCQNSLASGKHGDYFAVIKASQKFGLWEKQHGKQMFEMYNFT